MLLVAFREQLSGRQVVAYIDNAGPRASLVNQGSMAESMTCISRAVAKICADNPAYLWYSRVPSESNIANSPSRGVEHPLLAAAFRVRVNWKQLCDLLFVEAQLS